MNSLCLPASFSLYSKIRRTAITNSPWKFYQQNSASIFFKSSISYCYAYCACQWRQGKKSPPFPRKRMCIKAKKGRIQVTEEAVKDDEKKGTVTGAVALIIGTSIGSGMLALPQKASSAGLLPSSISMILCWAFLQIEALLLIEINVGLRKKRGLLGGGSELEVISISTMAQETLGDWGETLATVTYVFLGYTCMIAYSSKSGEILFHLMNLPESVSSGFFTALFTILISVGGTQTTDQVNQWLTASMIGLLLAIEILAVQFGGWSGLVESAGDWAKVPDTIPVMIFSLVYHDITPVLCAYLGGDLKLLRASVLLGGLVPLFALLVWDAVALGLSVPVDQVVDPVELLMRVQWNGVSYMVEAFSLLAVGTSLIGSILGFSEFFKEQLKKFSFISSPSKLLQEENKSSGLKIWWERNNITVTAMAIVFAPTLLVSTCIPDAFSAATEIAGGYCMTMLYGVLPAAMAWAASGRDGEDNNPNALSRAKPAIFGVGLFACGILAEQIVQDVLALQS